MSRDRHDLSCANSNRDNWCHKCRRLLYAKVQKKEKEQKVKRFVLSMTETETKQQAEQMVSQWNKQGTLRVGTKLYEIKSVYDLKLKFIKRKEVKNGRRTNKK